MVSSVVKRAKQRRINDLARRLAAAKKGWSTRKAMKAARDAEIMDRLTDEDETRHYYDSMKVPLDG